MKRLLSILTVVFLVSASVITSFAAPITSEGVTVVGDGAYMGLDVVEYADTVEATISLNGEMTLTSIQVLVAYNSAKLWPSVAADKASYKETTKLTGTNASTGAKRFFENPAALTGFTVSYAVDPANVNGSQITLAYNLSDTIENGAEPFSQDSGKTTLAKLYFNKISSSDIVADDVAFKLLGAGQSKLGYTDSVVKSVDFSVYNGVHFKNNFTNFSAPVAALAPITTGTNNGGVSDATLLDSGVLKVGYVATADGGNGAITYIGNATDNAAGSDCGIILKGAGVEKKFPALSAMDKTLFKNGYWAVIIKGIKNSKLPNGTYTITPYLNGSEVSGAIDTATNGTFVKN